MPPPLRILLVEDDSRLGPSLVEIMVQNIGAEVALAETIEKGRAEFHRLIHTLHAAVLDYWLDRPGTVTSIPLYKEMNEHDPDFARSRVLLCSSKSEADVRKEFAAAGAPFPSFFLEKNIRFPRKLMEWLTSLPVADGSRGE